VVNAASHHGRILVLNRENAKESTGHGSPLPTLVHGGPGRAGGGEEMGGMRGVKHYLQRTAIQGSPTTLTEITGIYQPGGAYIEAEQHPFKYHWEDIQPGMSLKTHKRTITDSDIINFTNLTWDNFYAHTDITSLDGSIFEKRTAHGYFILAAAAGLFVYPNKGPVSANYGLEDCRFIRPIYHNDTISVRLTCKQKIDRDSQGPQLPNGIVKWYAEVFDAEDEIVAIATVLTMVQKKNPFAEINKKTIETYLSKLSENTKSVWGKMSPQHMVEHLEYTFKIASGEIQGFEFSTPENKLEKVHDSLYNHIAMPRNFEAPQFLEKDIKKLQHENLTEAKQKLLESYDDFEAHFQENSETTTKNVVFGMLNKFEWNLFHTKHINHHFKQFGLL
ncbi:MAG: phenylacetic acid degradation bifunctional protein PaaZ, partial [Bacteroidetes bacterium]